MPRNYLKLGSWNALCDVCGFKFKSEQLRKRWDGLMVCSEDFELRHMQDFVQTPIERIAPPWTRPTPPDTFIDGISFVCTFETVLAIAGVGTAGCALVGNYSLIS